MASPHAFPPDLLTGFCHQASRDAAFLGHRKQQVINNDRRWNVWGASGRAPGDMGVSHITSSGRTNGQEMSGQAAGKQVDQAVVEERAAGDIESTEMVYPPQLFSGGGFIGDCRLGGRGNQLTTTIQLDQLGCCVGLLVVAGLLLFDLPRINTSSSQGGIPVGLHVAVPQPTRLSCLLVQGNEELFVDPIEGHEQRLLVDDRRRSRPHPVVAVKITTLPDLLAAVRIQAGRSVAPEVHVDPSRLDDRGRCCVSVQIGIRRLRPGDIKHLDVVDDLSALEVHAQGKQFPAVLAGGGQPDLLAPHNRRRIPLAVNCRFPANIFRFAELHRQVRRQAPTVAAGTTELVPVGLCLPLFSGRNSDQQQRHGQDD